MDNRIDSPHAEKLRLHRRMDGPGTFFITKCLEPRKMILIKESIAEEIIKTLKFSVLEGRIYLAAFVVMPDHWHALFSVNSPWTLPEIMKSTNTWIGKKSSAAIEKHNIKWLKGYYDTRIRSGKQFSYVYHYIENNPRERGLEKEANKWQWNSANPEYQDFLMRPWPWQFEEDV